MAFALQISACKLTEHEVSQTKSQISKLSEQAGIDNGAVNGAVTGAVASVNQAYNTHLSPVIAHTDEVMEAVEFYHNAKESGSQAVETVKRTCEPLIETGGQLISSMPQSERELQQLVISYNDEFAEMLRGYAGQLKKTQLGGRRGKGGLASLGISGGRPSYSSPSYSSPTDVRMHVGGNRHGPTR